MKKLIALALCLVVLLVCFTACKTTRTNVDKPDGTTADSTTAAPETPPAETTAPDAALHINYKGLETATFTEAEMRTAEGRDEDFSVPQGDSGDEYLYIYNNVTLDTLTFTQVQFTYSDKFNRISCTYTGEETAEALERYKAAMLALYGEPTEAVTGDNQTIFTWRDGVTANYLQLTQLNADTVQLVFYLCEGAQ